MTKHIQRRGQVTVKEPDLFDNRDYEQREIMRLQYENEQLVIDNKGLYDRAERSEKKNRVLQERIYQLEQYNASIKSENNRLKQKAGKKVIQNKRLAHQIAKEVKKYINTSNQSTVNIEYVTKKEMNIAQNYGPNIEHNGGALALPDKTKGKK